MLSRCLAGILQFCPLTLVGNPLIFFVRVMYLLILFLRRYHADFRDCQHMLMDYSW